MKESKKWWISLLLSICAISISFVAMGISWQSLGLQRISNIPNDIILEFTNLIPIYTNHDLVGLAQDGENRYVPVEAYFEIRASNKGRENTGFIKYYLNDQKNNFSSVTIENIPVDSSKPETIRFYAKYERCHSISPVIGENAKNKALQRGGECNYEQIEGGLMTWILKVELGESKCYYFDICVTNSTINEEWCNANLPETNMLRSIPCP